MVNTRTLRDYLASFQPTPNNEGTLVTVNLETVTSAAYLTPGTVATVALSGDYNDLIDLPTLGTAAAADASDFATAAQGNLADSAVQPIDLSPVAFSGLYGDLSNKPTLGAMASKDNVAISDIAASGTPSSATFLRGDGSWALGGGGGGGGIASVVGGTGIDVDNTDPENPVVNIESGYLATVATTGSYDDLSDLPTLGDLAALDTINNGNWSGTDLAVSNGGTGASDAAGARTNLGLVIGTNVQAYSANLSSWSSVTRATGFDTFAATPTSANLRALLTDEVGTGAAYFVGGALGTPASVTLTNGTGLPISTGVSGLGTGVATFLATPTSANLAAAVTNETGSGSLVFATSPTLVTPNLGTPSAVTLTNATGLPLTTGITGTLAIANGGTGQATAENAFNALKQTATTSATGVIQLGTTAEVRVKTATDRALTPGNAWAAAAWVNLGNITGTVTLDFSTFIQVYAAMTGNITLAQPSNLPDGVYTFHVTHSGAARTISLNATYWDTPGGSGLTLSTTAGQSDLLTIIKKPGGKALISVAALNVGS